MKPLPPRKEYVDITTPEEKEQGFNIVHKEFDPYGDDIYDALENMIVKLHRNGQQYGCWGRGSPAQFKEGLKATCLSAAQYDETHPTTEDKSE